MDRLFEAGEKAPTLDERTAIYNEIQTILAKDIPSVLAAAHVVTALQTIVSRRLDPRKSLVISVSTIHGGDVSNVIPQSVRLTGTVRSLSADARDLAEQQVPIVAKAAAAIAGATAEVNYHRFYPPLYNHPEQTAVAIDVARDVSARAGLNDGVNSTAEPALGSEDFAFMLEERPGAFIFMGNGQDNGMLHHPAYDFNDNAIPYGISYWVNLVTKRLNAGGV